MLNMPNNLFNRTIVQQADITSFLTKLKGEGQVWASLTAAIFGVAIIILGIYYIVKMFQGFKDGQGGLKFTLLAILAFMIGMLLLKNGYNGIKDFSKPAEGTAKKLTQSALSDFKVNTVYNKFVK